MSNSDKPSKDKDEKKPAGSSGGKDSKDAKSSKGDSPDIKVKEEKAKDPVFATFGGPKAVDVPLRLAMDKKAFGDVTAHAKESLDVEICGVLAGQLCEDDEGLFVQVKAAIRGNSARQGSTHVTFTQETWTKIHDTLDKDYPKLEIVGWYHSHPGFGVEFSEMDLFIQKNFFRKKTQVAMLTDPLGGEVAVCIQGNDGPEYLPRFWIEGREHRCRTPASASEKSSTGGKSSKSDGAGGSDLAKRIDKLEERLTQVIEATDRQRERSYRFLLFVGMLVATAAIVGLGYSLYRSYASAYTPPQDIGPMIPVPVVVHDTVLNKDRTVMLGVRVVSWDIPPELNAAYMAAVKEAVDKAIKESGGLTTAPTTAPTKP